MNRYRILLAFLIVLIVVVIAAPFAATITFESAVVLRTPDNDSDWTLGNSLSFHYITINGTHFRLDQSYLAGYSTQYYIWVTSPNSTAFTLNSWFATANSSGQIQITSPSATNLYLSFYSPQLISAYVVGASYTYVSANQTLLITANTDTNNIFTIHATVSQDAEPSITPEAYSFNVTDMEGCGNWLFSEESYYTFQGEYWDGDGYANLDTMKIRWSDGLYTVEAQYDQPASTWTLLDGSSIVTLRTGVATAQDDNLLRVTFPLRLTNRVLDAWNVTVSLWCNDTAGLVSGWEAFEDDVFNIYNLGGLSDLTTSGNAGRSVGGDVFELWAGGQYGDVFFEENFEHDSLGGWGTFQPGDNQIEITDTLTTPVDDFGYKSLWLNDTGANVARAWHWIYTQTDIVYVTVHAYLDDTDEIFSIKLQENSSVNSEVGPWVKFETDGKFYFVNYTSPYDYEVTSYAQNTWINITLIINVTSFTYDIYYDEVLMNSSVAFYQNITSISVLMLDTDTGGVPQTDTATVFVDNIKVWSPVTGGNSGEATATVTFRKFQHIHTQFAIGIPVGFSELQYPNEGYVEFGIDYCINDTWIENGWKVRISILDARIAGAEWTVEGNNWIKLYVAWYDHLDGFVKADTVYTLWEGGPGGLGWGGGKTDYFRLWLDLWFNKVNGSQLVGGRVNSYYYGMHDNAHSWFTWLTGSDWGPMVDDVSQSMYFNSLTDSNGNVISSRQIELMRIRAKVWRSANYDFRWMLRDFDILNFELALTEMRGIDTPIFVATKTADMPQGGFLAALAAALNDGFSVLAEAMGPVLLSFWDTFVGFIDTVFSWAGWPNGFSQILSWIGTLLNYIVDGFTYMLTFLSSWFTFMFSFLGKLFNTLSIAVTYWVQIIQNIFSMISGGLGTGINIYESLNLPVWIILLAILYPIFLFEIWDQRGIEPMLGHVKMVADIFGWIFHMLLSTVQLFLNLIGRIIESIPVVE